MLEVHVRDKNRIINLIAPGKPLLRGRTGSSMYLHNPLDLLLASIGLCVGGKLLDYCRFNDLDVRVFESLTIINTSDCYELLIRRPINFNRDHEKRLERELTTCSVSKELTREIKIVWSYNTIPTKDLMKEEAKGCCGD